MRQMNESPVLDSFVDKWRAHWPEWAVAEAFLPAAQREPAVAWFALLHEFAGAAWGGTDPAPGLAKLAWWQEELRGWAQGARRHPLGALLQPAAAPWEALADAMPLLRDRQMSSRPLTAPGELQALGQVCAAVEAVLFGAGCSASALAVPMSTALAPAVLSLLAGPVVRSGGAAAATALLQAGPAPPVSARVVRLHAALVRLRLRQAEAGGLWVPAPRWRTLHAAWHAARN